MQNVVWHCPVERSTSLNQTSSGWHHVSLQTSALTDPSQTCKLTVPRALTHQHAITDAGFWTWHWYLDALFGPEARRTQCLWFPKDDLKWSLVKPQLDFFYFASVHFRSGKVTSVSMFLKCGFFCHFNVNLHTLQGYPNNHHQLVCFYYLPIISLRLF